MDERSDASYRSESAAANGDKEFSQVYKCKGCTSFSTKMSLMGLDWPNSFQFLGCLASAIAFALCAVTKPALNLLYLPFETTQLSAMRLDAPERMPGLSLCCVFLRGCAGLGVGVNIERARGGKDAAACDVVGGRATRGRGQRKRVCCVCGGARDALYGWPQGTTPQGSHLEFCELSEAFCVIDVVLSVTSEGHFFLMSCVKL